MCPLFRARPLAANRDWEKSGIDGKYSTFDTYKEFSEYMSANVPLGSGFNINVQTFINAKNIEDIKGMEVLVVKGLYVREVLQMMNNGFLSRMEGNKMINDMIKDLNETDLGLFAFSIGLVNTEWVK